MVCTNRPWHNGPPNLLSIIWYKVILCKTISLMDHEIIMACCTGVIVLCCISCSLLPSLCSNNDKYASHSQPPGKKQKKTMTIYSLKQFRIMNYSLPQYTSQSNIHLIWPDMVKLTVTFFKHLGYALSGFIFAK